MTQPRPVYQYLAYSHYVLISMNRQLIIHTALAILFAHLLLSGQAFSQKRKPLPPIQGSKTLDPNKPPFSLTSLKNPTFQTKEKLLLDPCGNPVILKGVNKLSVFDDDDPTGTSYFPQIAKTGANCVRIVWEMNAANPLTRLDQLISNARASNLIPIVGLWDFTETDDGGFSHLNDYVNYWKSPAVVNLIKKHQAYLIVNIANEAATGDETNSADLTTYATAYKSAVLKLRSAGINVPLMIDGMDRGKSLLCFAQKGPEILNADPKHNLIFSFHAYWPKTDTDSDPTFIANAFAKVSSLPIVLVIGELAGFGAGQDNTKCAAPGTVDYLQFAQRADTARMGWMLWEWGPKGDPNCASMDITTDGTFSSILTTPNTWVRDLVLDKPFSLKNTQKTPFITSGLKSCPRP
ncbi:cellulase family glycosylhydrolase [Spirosoma pollinicola]|uniref:Glycoside hydrolase family 5 domain-containing protein n=1 Tax=Spirosoma pollinicola TaxID=2057025 RepID=A0A2K8YXV0_9BACT|nr:cellulase family glycosylhydrolase [Spirosoma pollinicola]AUD02460.1 hypothetical protein CWM47_11860 [Spirosoma pollinicola]